MTKKPPEEAFIICTDRQWPLDIVESEAHAASTFERRNENDGRAHVYRVRIEVIEELVLTPPVPSRLVPKE
jgi:hypothetical protein